MRHLSIWYFKCMNFKDKSELTNEIKQWFHTVNKEQIYMQILFNKN